MTSALKFTAIAGLVAGVLFGTGALEAQAARGRNQAAARPNRAAQVARPARQAPRPVAVAPQARRQQARPQVHGRPVRPQVYVRPQVHARPQVIVRPQWRPVVVPAPRYNPYSDRAIHVAVLQMLSYRFPGAIYGLELEVERGEVEIEGRVANRYIRQLSVQNIYAIPGVRKVDDDLDD